MASPPRIRTVVWAPEPVTSQMPRDWTRSHTETQRRHLMHLALSRRMGRAGSQGRWVASLRKGTDRMFMALDRVCREQLPLRTQVTQWSMCWERMSSTLVLRVRRTRWVLVWTTMPFSTWVLQAVASLSTPSTSTAQMRQEATSLISRR